MINVTKKLKLSRVKRIENSCPCLFIIFHKGIRVETMERVTLEQKLKGGKGVSCVQIWGRRYEAQGTDSAKFLIWV